MKNIPFSRGLKSVAIAILLTMTGCAEYHRRVLEDTPETGCAFTKELAKQYEELGKIEQGIMYDESSADYYYRKAIRVKEGCLVGPTTLEKDKWDIDRDKIPELAAARERLVHVLCLGARDIAPVMTARAQAHFDCWVEQQEEGWQKNDIAWCRSEFHKSIQAVERKLGLRAPVVEPQPKAPHK